MRLAVLNDLLFDILPSPFLRTNHTQLCSENGEQVICIGDVNRFLGPVRRHEAAEAAAVVASTEHVEAGFAIPFFAGELVSRKHSLG